MQRRWTEVPGSVLCATLLLAIIGMNARAQSANLGQGIATELQSLASHAGTVFVGQITSIQRKGSVVDITFRVDQPLEGAAGKSFVLHEWAGLWPPGHLRYIVGQRALAFLHTTGAAGLGSPVHGLEGLVPVVVQGLEAPQLIDVRRVAAAVLRAPNTPLPTDAEAGMLLSDAVALISPQGGVTVTAPHQLPLPTRGRQPIVLPSPGDPIGPISEPVLRTHAGPLRMPVATSGLR